MVKRIIALILAAVLLVGAVPAAAATGTTPETVRIRLNFAGAMYTPLLLRGNNEKLLAPISWIGYFGPGMECTKEDNVRCYYKTKQSELKDYAKRTFVNEDTGSVAVGLYLEDKTFAAMVASTDDYGSWDEKIMLAMLTGEALSKELDAYFSQKGTQVKRFGKHYLPLYQGTFSQMLSHDGDMWVPLEELLPLLEVKAAVSKDGRYLCMEPVQQTFFGFLYEYADEISDLLFNSEDVVGNNIMAGGGWIVSTASGELENLIPGNIGRTQDYADLFTDYLKDNEVYLNTYQIEENQDIKYVKDVAKTAGTLENIFSATAEALTPLYNIMLKEAVDPDFYKSYFKPAKALSFGIEVISSACEYAYAYANQVEDHRKMLYAVYDYKADTGWPSYKAAMNIAKIYDEDADKSMELFAKTTVDVSSGAISDAILGKVYGPWFAAMEITKAFCAEEYEYVVKSGSINLVSNTVQYAYRMFQSRFCNNELGGSSLDDMRLCLMMSLVGSRHAYKTYWGSSRQDDVDAIDKLLKQLYLAGKWEDTEATSTYILQKDKFRKDLPKLQTVKDDPVSVAELGLLTTAMMKDYYADFHYAPFDTDDDGVDELEISYFLKHQGKNVYIRIDFNEPNMEYIVTSIDATLAGVQEEKNTYTVWGVGKDMLVELDSHFAKRAGLMCCLKCDLEEDGDEDRIYCFYGAAKQYDRSQENNNVVFWDEGMTVMVAQNNGDSIDLRFFKDEYRNLVQLDAYYPNVQDHLGADSCTYGDGVLMVDGFAYEYQKSGVPFKALGSADLGTIEQYLTMEKDLWEYSEADLTHPYDSDPEYTKGTVNGMSVSHNAVWVDDSRKLNYFYLKPDGAEMFIEEGVSTNSTPNSLLEALSTVVDWDYSTVLKKGQREGGLMGPYPIPAGDGEIYESSLLWQLPNGDIYMILMITEDDSPDSPILELTFHLV